MKKSDTASRLRQLMRERGLKQVDIIEAAAPYCAKYHVKLNRSDISQYVSGKVAPSQEKLTVLSLALGVPEPWLMGYDMEPAEPDGIPPYKNIVPVLRRRIPLLGEIAAGEPIYAQEDHEAYVTADADLRCDFALRVKGKSMTGAHIFDGDIVFIKRQADVRDGQIAAVAVEDEATLKRVYHEKDGVTLVSENPDFKPMAFRDGDGVNVRILGLAVALHHRIL